MNDRAPDRLGLAPVLPDDRPECLVEVFAVAQEALAQHGLFHRSDFRERAVAPAVRYRGARLEAMHADCLECKLHRQPRSIHENPRAPERTSDYEPPFRRRESGLQLTELEQTDRRLHP